MSVVLQNNTANRISVGRFVLRPREALTISKTDFLHYDPFVPNSLAADLKVMGDLNWVTVIFNDQALSADSALRMASSDTDIEVFNINLAGVAAADEASAVVVADGNYAVLAVRAGVSLAVTANDTNFVTVSLINQTNGAAVVATETTETSGTGGSGDLVLWQDLSLVLDTAELSVTTGDVLAFDVTATGTGVAYDLTLEVVMVRV